MPDHKKPKRKKALARQITTELCPPIDEPPSRAEIQAFCSLVATGIDLCTAYQSIRPQAARSTAESKGCHLAKKENDTIRRLQEAAAQACALVHGVGVSYVVGHLKTGFETPIAKIDANSIYCKKHKVTETFTDAGPKTVTEIEKDSPLSYLQTMGKFIGLDGKAREREDEANTPQAGSRDEVIREFMAQLIPAGSPIQRFWQSRGKVVEADSTVDNTCG